MAQNVTTPFKAAQEFRVNRKVVERLIKEKKLQPVFQQEDGRGNLRFFDRSVLDPIIREYVDAEAAKVRQASAPPVQAAPALSLSGLEAQIAGMKKSVDLLDVTFAEHQAELVKGNANVLKVHEQNVLIMRKLCELVDTLKSQLGVVTP